MGEKEKGVEVANKATSEDIDFQSREIIAENVMKDSDGKDSTDHLSDDQIEDHIKETDSVEFSNDGNENINDVVASKDIGNLRCSSYNENDQSKAMVTASNGEEVEVKNGKVEKQKFDEEPPHGDEFNKDVIDAAENYGEKVEENDRLDMKGGKDGTTYEGEHEKMMDEVEDGLKTKEENDVKLLQDEGEKEEEKKGEITNPGEDEEQKRTLRNAGKDIDEVEGELDGREDNDAVGNLETKDDEPVKNLKSEGKMEKDDNQDDRGIKGETFNEVEFKANEDDTDLKALDDVKEDTMKLKSELRVETKQLENENDKDDDIEKTMEEEDDLKVDDEKEKCDEIEVEGKVFEECMEEAKEEKSSGMESDKEELVDDQPKEEDEKKGFDGVKEDGNENVKVGEVENMNELEKAENKGSEDEEKEIEDIENKEQNNFEDEENETADDAVEKIVKKREEDEESETEDEVAEKIEEKGLGDEEKEPKDEAAEKKEEKLLKDEEEEAEDETAEKNEERGSEDEEKETEDVAVENNVEKGSEDEEKESDDEAAEENVEKRLENEEKDSEDESVEKTDEKRLEDEEKESEDEAAERKGKPGKSTKRKGKRSKSREFEKRKMQKHGNLQENNEDNEDNEDNEETAEEDNQMKRKFDDEYKAPKISKKMRLTAKRSAERKLEAEKTAKKKKGLSENMGMEPITPYIGRPQRERKTVERLVSLIEKDASRDLKIGKGLGTPLKDIPNVSHNVSRRKTDDTLKLLHTIIFGRRTKAIQVKTNILRFSGFVWPGDEDKHRSKVKLKFEKCNKEKLLEFCDLFDLSVTKGSSKKEDIVSKLIGFLIHPRASSTPDKDKDSQSNKRIKNDSSSKNASSKSSSKRQRTSGSKRSNRFASDDEDSDDAQEEEGEENDEEIEEKSYEDEGNNSSDQKSDENEESEEEYRVNRSSGRKKRSASKGKKPNLSAKKKETKSYGKKRSKSTGKKLSETNEKDKSALTDDELRDAACEILNQVDFNTATFTDILKLLGKQFDTDLTSRKDSIKMMIQEELTKFAEEEAQKD